MKTILFLILLVVPSLFCSESVMEMIDKDPHSREIMNALFLQVQQKGRNLKRGDIYAILKHSRERADREESLLKARLARNKKSCKSDLSSFSAKVHENQKWEFTIGRHVHNNERAIARLRKFISRTGVEKDDYVSLSNIVNAGWKKWKNWHKNCIAGLKKVIAILKQARNALKRLDAEHGDSLIEVKSSHEYFTNLSEIKVNFKTDNSHLEGFRPVIENLLELASQSSAVNKSEVRRKLRLLFKKIARQIRIRLTDLEAILERQNSIFAAIIESYKENLLRVEKLLERLHKELAELNARHQALKDSDKQAVKITLLSSNIFKTKKQQCIDYVVRVNKIAVRLAKTRNIVAQIAETLSERFSSVRTYFIQRDTSLLQTSSEEI